MKKYGFLLSLRRLGRVKTALIAGLIMVIGVTATVMALNDSQKAFIAGELERYRNIIMANPDVFQTQESINQFYGIIKDGLGLKAEAIGGLIAALPNGSSSSGTVACTLYIPTYGACQSNNTKIAISEAGSPSGCTQRTFTASSTGCTYVPPSGGSGSNICTSWTYSAWGTCQSGTQTRNILTSSPSQCTGGNPVTTQSCTSAPSLCPDGSVPNSFVGVTISPLPSRCLDHEFQFGLLSTNTPKIGGKKVEGQDYVYDGTVESSGPLYALTVGISKTSTLRGCMKISTDASSCKTWDQFRDYTDEEWNGTTNQVYTMMPDLSFAAAGVYEGYVMYANDKIARKTGTITVKPLSFSLLSSNSESGPFVSNGTVDVGKPLFARVTGVDKNNPPRGCMGMVGTNPCVDTSTYRSFDQPSDKWVDGGHAIQTTLGFDIPAEYSGKDFASYIVYSNNVAQFVGVVHVK